MLLINTHTHTHTHTHTQRDAPFFFPPTLFTFLIYFSVPRKRGINEVFAIGFWGVVTLLGGGGWKLRRPDVTYTNYIIFNQFSSVNKENHQ